MGRLAWLFGAGVVTVVACGLDRSGALEGNAAGSGGAGQGGAGGTTTSVVSGGMPNSGGGPASTASGTGGNLMNGQPCAHDDQCESRQCVDGVCCGSQCPGSCQSCNQPGNEGSCIDIPAGMDPDLECPPDQACDGDGDCKQSQGTSCGDPEDCLSGECEDGFCCDMACMGPCRACDVAGMEGTCTNHPMGTDPEGCPNNDVCDGNGSCDDP